MIVRDAKVKDFKLMSNIFKQVDGLHSEAHPDIFNQPIDNARSNDYLISVFQNDKQKLIVAVEDSMIIGLAKADLECAPNIPLFVQREWLSISTIVVDENHRGKGIGKALLDSLYDWAKENNVNEVELTVFSFNESAIEFYKKNGFKDIRMKMSKNINDINKCKIR